MSTARLLLLFFGLCMAYGALAPPAYSQRYGPATDYVEWTVTADPETATPADSILLTFKARIDDGWKMYALDSPPPTRPVSVRLDALPTGLVQQSPLAQEEPKEGYDPNFDMEVRYFEKEATLRATLNVTPEALNGVHDVTGKVNFVICDPRVCLPPTDVAFAVPLSIEEALPAPVVAASPGTRAEATTPAPQPSFTGSGAAAVIDPDAATDQDAAPESFAAPAATTDFRAGGLWGFLLLAIGAGLAALLTPCVFPMIPLTVSYFTKHAHDRAEATRQASVYGLAIILTFTGLGLLMALLTGAAGAQTIAANPWINLVIGTIFIVFALSLLGLFELRLPTGVLNFFNRQSHEKKGYLGVLFMGFTLTLVSFSCTVPFVGALLAATARGSWAYPILGMTVFSATFALPFVVFALFPRGLNALPKSGSWMNVVKVVLGFVELAAAIKFLSNADLVWGWGLISRPLAVAVSVVIFFLTGLYLLGKLRMKHEPAVEHVGVGRLLFAIAFFGLSLYMFPGLLGAPLNRLDAYLPPRQSDDVSLLAGLPKMSGGAEDEAWITDDIDAAFAAAEAAGKPVFIDFTGYTCTNCRDMEANVFTRPEIAERFERDFVLLRLYTDGPKDAEFQRYQLQLTGTVALPTYAILHHGAEQPLLSISGTVKPERFAAFLDQGNASYLRNLAATD